MSLSNRPKINLRLPALGLVLQLFAIILLPLTLLLVAITFGSLSIHQKAMRTLVGERDTRAVRTAATALSAQVDNRVKELNSITQLLSANISTPVTATLGSIGYLMPDFEAGIVVFNPQGKRLAVRGDQQIWDTWMADYSSWQGIFNNLATQTGKLVVAHYPGNKALLGLISDRADDGYVIIGAFSITKLAETTLSNILPSDGQLSILLVGADNTILYNVGHLSDQSADHPGVAEALLGQSGTMYVKVSGDEHVTAYSPVASVGWALITEESWEAVSTPTLRTSQIAPLVLVPVVLIMLLALWFGASQVVRPLQTLESRSASLARGDFDTIQEPVGGVAEIQHLQKELIQMANRVEDAQRSLHGYIGAITEAQEDERRRLARELHDDTLQALIALKQRVQLAQLELQATTKQPAPESAELDEIANLTEQTIENLRRLTRALRTAYLEDLGLVPSLEMLARETSQGLGSMVEFHYLGIERRLDSSVELALYRMAQEALSNVTRHAQAKKASLNINFSASAVTLRVVDDGIGFNLSNNPSEYAAKGHYGLLGLHERAELIGATLQIQTSPGKGTRLTVTLPAQAAGTI
jgi:signal transduction histidine kinase